MSDATPYVGPRGGGPNDRGAPAVPPPDEAHPPPRRGRLIFWFVLVAIILAALIGGLWYFQFHLKPALIKDAVSKAAPPPASVTAEPATSVEWASQIHSVGTLTAINGIDVAPQVAGIVKAIKFDSGDRVEAGSTLVQLDDDIERADLASNEAALQQAKLDFARQEELSSKSFASKATFEAARAKRDAAAAAVQRSQALIAQKNIRAPFAGLLGIRKADLGQYVSPGTALVTLQTLDPIYVDFTVPGQDIVRLKEKDGLEVRISALPGEVFHGSIKVLDARLDPGTRMLSVRGEVSNPAHKLRPGMFATVTVITGNPEDVVTVPRTAVSYSLYGDSIFVVHAPQNAAAKDQLIAERRPVTLGDTRGDRVAVVKGIKAGEQVVTSGQLKLQPDAPVRINNDAALIPPTERPRQ